jgi:hypothetical protein
MTASALCLKLVIQLRTRRKITDGGPVIPDITFDVPFPALQFVVLEDEYIEFVFQTEVAVLSVMRSDIGWSAKGPASAWLPARSPAISRFEYRP